jgi:hypothetical protein
MLVISGACHAQWYARTYSLLWDAGSRDPDVNEILVCVYLEGDPVDNPAWSAEYNGTDNPELFPAVGQPTDAALDITQVVRNLDPGRYVFAAAYRNSYGMVSAWATADPLDVDNRVPGAPLLLRVEVGSGK